MSSREKNARGVDHRSSSFAHRAISSVKLAPQLGVRQLLILAIILLLLVSPYLYTHFKFRESYQLIHSHLHPAQTNFNYTQTHQQQQQQPQPLSTLDLWHQSWTNPALLSSSPQGYILPHLVNALNTWQNPADCANASYLLFEYRTSLGFGAVTKHFIVAFHSAVKTGRVLLIDERTALYWTKGCLNSARDGKHECFFQPLSRTCPYSTVINMLREKKLPEIIIDGEAPLNPEGSPIIPPAQASKPNVVRFNMPELEPKTFGAFLKTFGTASDFEHVIQTLLPQVSPSVNEMYLRPTTSARRVWTTCLAYYLLRLNAETALYIRTQLESLLHTNNPDYRRFIGMPIRASDKCYGNAINGPGEMACLPLATVMDHVHRIAFGHPHITYAIVTSEDATAITESKVTEAMANLTDSYRLAIVRNVGDKPPGSGSPRNRTADASNAVLLKSSLVTLHLQALASYHVLTPRSTFHSLINSMAKTTPGKMSHGLYPLGIWKDVQNSERSQLM